MFLFSAWMQIFYFLGLLLMTFNLFICVHSQGMFHHSDAYGMEYGMKWWMYMVTANLWKCCVLNLGWAISYISRVYISLRRLYRLLVSQCWQASLSVMVKCPSVLRWAARQLMRIRRCLLRKAAIQVVRLRIEVELLRNKVQRQRIETKMPRITHYCILSTSKFITIVSVTWWWASCSRSLDMQHANNPWNCL